VAAALATAAPAFGKSYRILQADEVFRIQPDGSVLATEELTFEFHGSFHGAYRLIPVAGTQRIDQVSVAENGFPYDAGADARVGSSGAPETYGVMNTEDLWMQVVWHFDAADANRTFTISYRMQGFVTAWDDVGNLYLQVWGDHWPVRVARLHARVLFPAGAAKSERKLLRVWGHPSSVHGTVRISSPAAVTLDATSVPAGQFVEVDTTFPRRLLAADGNFTQRTGDGLQQVVAREKRIFASPFGPSSGPVTGPSGGGGVPFWLWFLSLPLILLARLFGFGRGSGDAESGVSGFGGSLGGRGGGGGGGGGGGAW
jgi:uncharacterized membrane protein